MENQHRAIKGYRELSAEEIALMNEIKAKGEELRELVAKVARVIKDVPPGQAGIEHEADHPTYWLRYAEGSFRTGIMYAVRAVAQPASY
jgi:hypothetical protein